jgi:FMN-dependent NADH-azoreductase
METPMTLFRLDASIRQDGSVSREVADTVQASWLETHTGDTVLRRDLGATPLPANAWSIAVGAAYVEAAQRTAEQAAAVELASELADELASADAAIVAVPLYNFGVPAHVKAWIDLVITDSRFSAGAPQINAGKPVILVVARGGGYGAGTPREGWDHATAYLQRIFGDVWGMDVHIVEAELTLADVVPAMEALRPLAAQSRANAHDTAKAIATLLAEQVQANAAA